MSRSVDMAGIEKDLMDAQDALAGGDFQGAVSKYNKVLKADPKCADAYFGKAEASVGVPKMAPEEVMELYKKSVELDPDNARYYFSEFGVEYLLRAPVVMEKFLDDKTKEIILKKGLKYLLKAAGITEEEAKKLL